MALLILISLPTNITYIYIYVMAKTQNKKIMFKYYKM